MVLKTIVLCRNDKRQTWKIASQAALESLLRKHGVDCLVDAEYACHVTDYVALTEGGRYVLGEISAGTVELQTWNDKQKRRVCQKE